MQQLYFYCKFFAKFTELGTVCRINLAYYHIKLIIFFLNNSLFKNKYVQ